MPWRERVGYMLQGETPGRNYKQCTRLTQSVGDIISHRNRGKWVVCTSIYPYSIVIVRSAYSTKIFLQPEPFVFVSYKIKVNRSINLSR